MRSLLLVTWVGCASAFLWPQGVVHYAINKKDYDIHSQDEIIETLSRLQSEICLKFFNTPGDFTASRAGKILYISNPDKKKDCPPSRYSFNQVVVDMPIGYRCLDKKNISRIVVDMLRASVEQNVATINSYDLIKKFNERDDAIPRNSLLTAEDRNYLNAHYHHECGTLSHAGSARRSDDLPVPDATQMSAENLEYYADLLWPLGVVMYGVDPSIRSDDQHLQIVQHAMSTIELHSCVVFQLLPPRDQLQAKSFLWIAKEGEDMPQLGFRTGNQTLSLRALAAGAPGHAAHALLALLRALGVHMASNRYDRDNYVLVRWSHVMPGKEQYLERAPQGALLRQVPYDASSATHAPANFMCRDCGHPTDALTVLPLQDHLWQRTLTMGRRTDLSETDKQTLNILYGKECHNRFLKDRK